MDRRTFLRATAAALSPLGLGGQRGPFGADHAALVRVLAAAESARMRYLDLDADYVYSRPCFAPDGRHILYMRAPATSDPVLALNSNASPWSLWTVSVDGGEPELFFERPGFGATRPDWCWATGRIAVTGIRGDRAELWLLDSDGRNLTHLPVGDPPRTRMFYPSWYPEGDAVAVTDYATHEILRVDVSTGEALSLTDPAAVWAGMCSVSPDSGRGNSIAFAGQPPDEAYGVSDNVLWILEPGSQPVPLDSQHGRTPAWSPTGSDLAFSSIRRRPAPTFTLHPRTLPRGASAIFVQHLAVSAASAAPAAGVTPYDVSAIHPKWAPAGATLVCMANDLDHPRMGLALIDLTS